MSSKRVLIITYYWPPSAGSGVQRWLKFAKYLPEFGWEPVIFTPENPAFELQDHSLAKEIDPSLEVIKFPIWEPYGIFKKLKGQQVGDPSKILEKKKPSFFERLSIWLRANVLIPDPRVFWVNPSVSFLEDAFRKGQYQAVITTGPPHSMHVIGMKLHEKTGTPWLADFRDPWSQWEFLDTLPMLPWVRKYHRKLEQKVLTQANAITTISPTFQRDLANLAQREIHLLTNGFDGADFPQEAAVDSLKEKDIEIVYSGVIDAIRNPLPFLDAFKKAFEKGSKTVRLRFVGKVSIAAEEYVKKDAWLAAHVEFVGYVSHQRVFEFYQAADMLLLLLTTTKNAQGNIPGKLFEYMASGKMILGLGDPEGDAANIIKQAHAGMILDPSDETQIMDVLVNFDPKEEMSHVDFIERFSRRSLTRELSCLLQKITLEN
ncbi:glycosyltransferase family 4 protein [Mongoliitalea daihaiensis]|uniref:glycosyltransferase family 4 protein n=1 Tax=Mongoliitalea daihaiensis TaxID=2782006 RepID=UPI001F351940|nr:glycosyltransferase family 4 protein [Mongoliitalea daihaiensis]UJP63751.1 glycosyltransferase family 4 protein [Mongoliitalea daihaiensis]